MGQPKADLMMSPQHTLLDRAVSVLESTVSGKVWISRPHNYSGATPRDLVDDRIFQGPLVGIAQALYQSQYALVAVLAVDLPLVSSELFRQMYEQWAVQRSAAVVYPKAGPMSQPLAALWHRKALPIIEAALQDPPPLSVQQVVALLSSEHVEVPANLLVNINTPQDWGRFLSGGVDR
jgi:molybdopterin-guanine dinucleotide biosynthesis protein A